MAPLNTDTKPLAALTKLFLLNSAVCRENTGTAPKLHSSIMKGENKIILLQSCDYIFVDTAKNETAVPFARYFFVCRERYSLGEMPFLSLKARINED